jgi:hypothetical protein
MFGTKYIWGFIYKGIAFFVGIFSLFAFGYLKGRKAQDGRHEKEELEKQVKQQEKVINKQIENASKKEKIGENIKAQNQKEKELIEKVKEKKKYNMGQWVIFAFIITCTISCTRTKIEYVETPCLKPIVLERPSLNNVEIYPDMILDNDTFNKIIENDIKLKSLIKKYEMMINIINEGGQ